MKKRSDPSGTATIRRAYEAQFVRRVKSATAVIVRAVALPVNALGIRIKANVENPPNTPLPPIANPNLAPVLRIEPFMDWANNVIAEVLISGNDLAELATPGGWQRSYVRRAFVNGQLQAINKMRRTGTDIPVLTPSQLSNSEFLRERVSTLYSSNLGGLKGIGSKLGADMERIIHEALIAGDHPNQTARNLRDAAGISINRARAIARTETIRANAEGEIASFERFGQLEIELDAEFITAGDGRVCPICAAIAHKVYSLAEARGMIPVHVNCRCSWAPVQKD